MKPYRLVVLAFFAALASACASAPKTSAEAPAEDTVITPVAASDAVDPGQASADNAAAVADAATDTAVTAADTSTATAQTAEEADFSAIYGQPGDPANADPNQSQTANYDPWQGYNRKMHAFNNAVDKGVARPLARGYTKVVPRPIRTGISNFFDNLGSPLDMINLLLQGHPKEAWDTLGRFLMNTTFGIGGLFDPASKARIARHDADFGQTLAVWGWRRSRYFELPLFGPRTIRDTFGLAGDVPLSATHYVNDDTVRYGLQGLQLVDTRAQLLPLDSLREGAADDYALVRDAWLQRRNYLIEQRVNRDPQADDGLPDYLRESDSPNVPANAMPIP